MREIEIKARVTDGDAIRAALIRLGATIADPVTQHDVVWGAPGIDGGSDNTSPWLRIRSEKKKEDERHILTLKRSVTNQLDSIEHETGIDDPEQMVNIIN